MLGVPGPLSFNDNFDLLVFTHSSHQYAFRGFWQGEVGLFSHQNLELNYFMNFKDEYFEQCALEKVGRVKYLVSKQNTQSVFDSIIRCHSMFLYIIIISIELRLNIVWRANTGAETN